MKGRRSGIVYLVGAGPGDPDLVTVRGQRLLARADVVLYDRLIHPNLLDYVRPGARRVYVGKAPGATRSTVQQRINAALVVWARRVSTVVRLHGGDPGLFGRAGEEADYLARHGIRCEIVPGVSAAWGAPAAAGIVLTRRGLSRGVVVLDGHDPVTTPVPPPGWNLSVVLLMAVARLPDWGERLRGAGWDPACPAAIVEWGTWGDQRVHLVTVADLAAGRCRAEAPATVVVGPVVQRLAPWPLRPLAGVRIVGVSVGPGLDRLAAWRRLGAEVVRVQLHPLRDAAPCPGLDPVAAWHLFERPAGVVVFESATAVARLACERDPRRWGRIHEAVVAGASPGAVSALRALGLSACSWPRGMGRTAAGSTAPDPVLKHGPS